MHAAGARLLVPLVSQGELLGVLTLGPRLSQQDYSLDDRTLLAGLATQVSPSIRVAQLVRLQQVEAQERERLDHELQIASLIQHTLLPRDVPHPPGYDVQAYYQPAREVGGDFYDFIPRDDGRLGIVVGDVTDKGVPAALVMATTRSVLRGVAQELERPGAVLARANDLLCPDVPANMFVTCLYAVLDPQSGGIVYANAGHDMPYLQGSAGVRELRARGMPLGLMTGMEYEEKESVLEPGDAVIFYSDGIVEAHDPRRQMFGFPRMARTVKQFSPDEAKRLVDHVLEALAEFTGPDWEQEDDITMVTVTHLGAPNDPPERRGSRWEGWESIAEFGVPSAPGNERIAIRRVLEAADPLRLEERIRERLKTAVGEATMNAMEHGNQFHEELPVGVEVLRTENRLAVRITDSGQGADHPATELPDLDLKLEGLQSARGWGLFLIEKMVDEVHEYRDERGHTVELVLILDQSPEPAPNGARNGGHDAEQ
jgi:serine phosphatase RsbU (regulator of sigma subunit)/anti-sigma regulatory factor (Ser/Thr protein kinase)